MKSKSLLALLLALVLCLGLVACGGNDGGNNAQDDPGTDDQQQGEPEAPEEPEATFPAAEIGTELGAGIENFTFTDYNGTTHDLYETLKEKKMVLINIWATWCGPCRNEFPYMNEAYEAYKDDIEIFAMSCEETDTDEVIAEFAADMGLTFPMGPDSANLGDVYATEGIPTSLIIDRYGVICFFETGSITSVESFQNVFDIFTADDYPESVILSDGVPATVPDVEPASADDLAAALGGDFIYSNPEDEYNWPVTVEGDHVLTSNVGHGGSTSAVNVEVTAEAGDVFAVDYTVSSEAGYDFVTFYVNDEMVKYVSGEREATYAYKFDAAGTYTVTLAYEKDEASDEGNDCATFQNVRLLSGDEAAALLASMPTYPTAAETTLTVTTPGAQEVVLSDSSGTLANAFGENARYYIIPGDTSSFSATLAEGLDAECAAFYSYYDNNNPILSDCVSGDHYEFSTGIDSYETSGYSYCYVQLQPSINDAPMTIVFFNDEANLNAFIVNNFANEDGTIDATWKYADGTAPESAQVSEAAELLEEGESLYYLAFVDQNGDPVEGVMANICDDETCSQMLSDANGIVAFVYPTFEYHIQVIKVPEGYEYDLSTETYIDADNSVTEFVMNK